MAPERVGTDAPEPFEARPYLDEYFRDVDAEYDALYRFWCSALARAGHGLRALEVGCGPALYSTFCLASCCTEVHLADYVPSCFAEIERWLRRDPGHFDWSAHVRMVLEIEDGATGPDAIAAREDAVRRIVTRLTPCDLRDENPLGPAATPYDVVTAHYCVEMATSTAQEWAAAVAHVCRLVRPGGLLLLSSAIELKRLRVFRAGEPSHAAASVSVAEAQAALAAAGMDPAHTTMKVIPAPEGRPYSATLLVAATRGS